MKKIKVTKGRRTFMDHKKMTIEEMCFESEKQLFDRKSARISATALVSTIIAFANADGGKIAIGRG